MTGNHPLRGTESRAAALSSAVLHLDYDDRLLGVSIYHAITANA